MGNRVKNVYVDGTDFTIFVNTFGEIGADLFGTFIVIYSILIVGGIWIVYGIVYLIIKIINKCKQKKKLNNL